MPLIKHVIYFRVSLYLSRLALEAHHSKGRMRVVDESFVNFSVKRLVVIWGGIIHKNELYPHTKHPILQRYAFDSLVAQAQIAKQKAILFMTSAML